MEDGPYKNTRSSAGSLNKSQGDHHIGTYHEASEDSTISSSFNDPQNTPRNQNKNLQQRNRTPSGHLLANSVGDIRNFFDKNNINSPTNEVFRPNIVSEVVNGNRLTARTSLVQSTVKETSRPRNTLSSFMDNSDQPNVNITQSVKGKRELMKCNDNRQLTASLSESEILSQISKSEISVNAIDNTQSEKRKQTSLEQWITPRCNKGSKVDKAEKQTSGSNDKENQKDIEQISVNAMSQGKGQPPLKDKDLTGGQLDDQLKQLEKENMPQVMDLRVVIQMFKEIKTDLQINNDKIDGISTSQETTTTAVTGLKKEVKFYKRKSDAMSSVIQQMAQQMGKLEKRVSYLEAKTKKPSVLLSGLRVDSDKKIAKLQIKTFFTDSLGVATEIEDVYEVGDKDTKKLVVAFEDSEQKSEVLKNKMSLKGLVNKEGIPFYVNDHVSAEINEKRTRERQIFQDNKRNTANQLEMSFFRGGLKIQNEVYKSKVSAPSPSDILDLTEDEFKKTLDMPVQQGERVTATGNVIVGFNMCTTSHQEINKAYIKMKLKYPQSKHIVCVYNIPGIERHFCADYDDDGDTGVGRKLLGMMKNNNVSSRAIFLVRYSNGTKLGLDRFRLYMEAAKNAIKAHPYNKITKKEDVITSMSPQKKNDFFKKNARGNFNGRGGTKQTRTYTPISKSTIAKRIWMEEQQKNDEEMYQFTNPWKVNEIQEQKERDDGAWGTQPPEVENWPSVSRSYAGSEDMNMRLEAQTDEQ